MTLVNHSKIKEIVGSFNISAEFFPHLDKEVEKMIIKAVERAKQNQRRTVMARDV